MKERLDVILVEQGYAPSREKAKAIIMSGNVYVNGQKEDKAGTGFDVSKIKLEVRNHTMKYVSRGGLKLEKAMEEFAIALDQKTSAGRHDLHGYRCIYRRLHGLHAPERSHEGVFRGRGTGAVSLETAE